MITEEQERLVSLYQETKDETYFNQILEVYRGRIQARAYKVAQSWGIDVDDVESSLTEGLWECCKSWDAERGVTFPQYVKAVLNTKVNDVLRSSTYKDGHLELEYDLYGSESMELVDARQDVAAIYEEQEAAKALLEFIASKKELYATVAALKANGYSHRDVARLLGYAPDGLKDLDDARYRWTKKKLVAAQKPALEYYREVAKVDKLPIGLVV